VCHESVAFPTIHLLQRVEVDCTQPSGRGHARALLPSVVAFATLYFADRRCALLDGNDLWTP